MKAYKIKKTITQEYISFGRSREDAIENFEYSQGYDFNGVTINGERFVNGEVLSAKSTATSMGKDNLIVFEKNDRKFAQAMWLKMHEDTLMIGDWDGTTQFVSNVPTAPHENDEIKEKAELYKNGSKR